MSEFCGLSLAVPYLAIRFDRALSSHARQGYIRASFFGSGSRREKTSLSLDNWTCFTIGPYPDDVDIGGGSIRFFIIPFDSGIGNQLFVVNAGLAYADFTGRGVVFIADRAWSQKRHGWFRDLLSSPAVTVKSSWLFVLVARVVNFLNDWKGSSKRRFVWDSSASETLEVRRFLSSSSIFYSGYFQSALLVTGITKFELKEPQIPTSTPVDFGSDIAVHLRRGDYLELEDYDPLDMDRIFLAVKEIPAYESTKIVMFTDSVDIVRSQLRSSVEAESLQIVFAVDLFGQTSPCQDFLLIAKYERVVISNSTFSWWAAALGKRSKTVFAPVPWSRSSLEGQDFLLDGWQGFKSNI